MTGKTLFRFTFSAEMNHQQADLLREASEMRIGAGEDDGRDPGRGSIGDKVSLWMYQGKEPDSWQIEAWAHGTGPFDTDAVERRRQRIRRVLPQITDHWEEVGI